MNEKNQIIIYQTEDGQTSIDVKMEGETVWLNQQQMAELFDTDRTSILRHIKNIYKIGELEEKSTCAKIAQVRLEGKRRITREQPYYNLDMIISVGYRVNSKRGTQFRIWANKVLKEYLIKGYVVNNKLAAQKYEELSQLVSILGRTIQNQPALTNEENRDLIGVVADYNYALDTLDRYDYQQLSISETTPSEKFRATYDNAISATLFLWFMQNNGILYRPDGTKRISDGTLVALTLMIAESKTEEKDVMVKVVVNLINKKAV